MASDEGALSELAAGDHIDVQTFEQILEMDDDDDKEFSKGIVMGFLEQAEQTFSDMDERLENKDLSALSSLGHFLKGSSATLGLTNLKQSCEKIQHLGLCKDETGEHEESPEKCLKAIKTELEKLREEYKWVETLLRNFYAEAASS